MVAFPSPDMGVHMATDKKKDPKPLIPGNITISGSIAGKGSQLKCGVIGLIQILQDAQRVGIDIKSSYDEINYTFSGDASQWVALLTFYYEMFFVKKQYIKREIREVKDCDIVFANLPDTAIGQGKYTIRSLFSDFRRTLNHGSSQGKKGIPIPGIVLPDKARVFTVQDFIDDINDLRGKENIIIKQTDVVGGGTINEDGYAQSLSRKDCFIHRFAVCGAFLYKVKLTISNNPDKNGYKVIVFPNITNLKVASDNYHKAICNLNPDIYVPEQSVVETNISIHLGLGSPINEDIGQVSFVQGYDYFAFTTVQTGYRIIQSGRHGLRSLLSLDNTKRYFTLNNIELSNDDDRILKAEMLSAMFRGQNLADTLKEIIATQPCKIFGVLQTDADKKKLAKNKSFTPSGLRFVQSRVVFMEQSYDSVLVKYIDRKAYILAKQKGGPIYQEKEKILKNWALMCRAKRTDRLFIDFFQSSIGWSQVFSDDATGDTELLTSMLMDEFINNTQKFRIKTMSAIFVCLSRPVAKKAEAVVANVEDAPEEYDSSDN